MQMAIILFETRPEFQPTDWRRARVAVGGLVITGDMESPDAEIIGISMDVDVGRVWTVLNSSKAMGLGAHDHPQMYAVLWRDQHWRAANAHIAFSHPAAETMKVFSIDEVIRNMISVAAYELHASINTR